MAESDPAIIGVESCGCVTYALARPPERLTRAVRAELGDIVEGGGSIVHTTVGEARARDHFLPTECPHDPKGWEPEV